jgi:hypothetical protein
VRLRRTFDLRTTSSRLQRGARDDQHPRQKEVAGERGKRGDPVEFPWCECDVLESAKLFRARGPRPRGAGTPRRFRSISSRHPHRSRLYFADDVSPDVFWYPSTIWTLLNIGPRAASARSLVVWRKGKAQRDIRSERTGMCRRGASCCPRLRGRVSTARSRQMRRVERGRASTHRCRARLLSVPGVYTRARSVACGGPTECRCTRAGFDVWEPVRRRVVSARRPKVVQGNDQGLIS